MEVDKVTIARRLLDEAIRGRVRGDDVLTVHLGAQAAFMLTRDLRKRRGLGPVSIDPYIRQDARRAFWNAFGRLNNALKHADRDPEAQINIRQIDGLSEMAIFLAAENLGALEPQVCPSFWIIYFRALFLEARPEALGADAPLEFVALVRGGIMAQVDREAFVAYARNPAVPSMEIVPFLVALNEAALAHGLRPAD